MLWRDPNANQNHRRGLLIDYDYAEKLMPMETFLSVLAP